MKTWTVVLEIKGEDYHAKQTVEDTVSTAIERYLSSDMTCRVMEIIEAPYGPKSPVPNRKPGGIHS